MTRDDEIRQALEELRREYIAELPGLVRELSEAVATAKQCASPECLKTAVSKAHALRGTAGSYRFHDISDAAGLIEDGLLGVQGGWLPPEQAWPAIDEALRSANDALAEAKSEYG